uniref:LSM12 homolog A n=1 Tax=Caligus clemensi TaxID=344056 RepID=C1C052_CALCM|nr:LSM12 homolog A [Caligus clemensi]
MSGVRSTSAAGRKDWISVGAMVSFSMDSPSVGGSTLRGEVVAHDPSTRFLVLKIPSGKCHSQWDVHMVNLSSVKDFKVLSEGLSRSGSESLPPLPSLNVQKLETRLRDSIEKKKRHLLSYKDGVSPEGQKLFRAVSKTLDEVLWDGQNIMVMDMVQICPPYKPENVKGSQHMEAFNHVKKIVEKHVKDQQERKEPLKKTAGASANTNVSNGGNTSANTNSNSNSSSINNNSNNSSR